MLVAQAETKPSTSETSVMKTESEEQRSTLSGLEASFGKANSFMLNTNLRLAEEGTSVQTDLTTRFTGL